MTAASAIRKEVARPVIGHAFPKNFLKVNNEMALNGLESGDFAQDLHRTQTPTQDNLWAERDRELQVFTSAVSSIDPCRRIMMCFRSRTLQLGFK
jgi:hypothetical protein